MILLLVYLGLFSNWNLVKANEDSDFRLPGDVLPVNYNLNLSTQLTMGIAVDGFVKINIKCISVTNKITLHSRQLEIHDVSVLSGTTNITSSWSTGITVNDFLIIELTESLVIDQTYSIEIQYQMKEWATKFGFFRKIYNNKKGETKEMFATQLQSTHARTAFPCFDEPGFKATFDVTLGHPSTLTAMSNMPNVLITETRNSADYTYAKFHTTPIMSTYLVAFAMVSEYSHRDVNANNVQLQLWASDDSTSELSTALDCSPSIYNFFYDYYNYSQPLSSEKMLVVPKFHTNGMENWGLITFSEWSLFDYGGRDLKSLDYLDRLYLIIAHEFNHLWLGNIVTPRWWTDLWLNEGLTTYMSVIAVHKTYTNISIMDRLILQGQIAAMQFDSSPAFPPIKSKGISNNADISKMFHPITYIKGACITKMMSGFIGETKLQNAFRTYIKKFAYKSVEEDDFLNVVDNIVTDVKVSDIIKSWTGQGGFPLVNVNIDYNEGKMSVTQERFIFGPPTSHTKDQKWWIPLTYKVIKESVTEIKTVWMNNTEASKEFELEEIRSTPTASFILNWNFIGFYRVNYDSATWDKIINQLVKKNSVIIKYSRIALISDAFTLAKAGKQNYTLPFKLIQYLSNEEEPLPRVLFFEEMKKIMPSVFSFELDEKLMDYIRSIFVTRQLNFDPPTERNYYKKYDWSLDQEFSCLLNINSCTQYYQEKFKEWMDKTGSEKPVVDPNVAETMLCTAIRNGGNNEWEFLKNQLSNTSYTPGEKNQFLSGLACSTNVTSLYELLSYTKNSFVSFKYLGGQILKGVMKTIYGRNALFQYIQNNSVAFNITFGAKVFTENAYELLTLTREKNDIHEIACFIKDSTFSEGTREQKIEKIREIRIKITINKEIRKKVKKWLSKNEEN
ncbi:aminopeptidase N [Lepeophtheirus salmonis]|uniref:aminopeptidase N n=1 Tax=Lepeophtheirus salmonis TaxID=72036 RepID=UPI001AE5D3A6|nr:aminopeptidase N-like [Lepeophtheirus salmonis]